MVKISFIGAGSAAFSMNVVKDLCLTEGLSGSEIALMDFDTVRLDAVYSMAKHYSAEIGATLRIEKTTDRKSALKDANFVIDTVRSWGTRTAGDSQGRRGETWVLQGRGIGGIQYDPGLLHDFSRLLSIEIFHGTRTGHGRNLP